MSWSSRLLLRSLAAPQTDLQSHSVKQSANEMETHDEHAVNPHEER